MRRDQAERRDLGTAQGAEAVEGVDAIEPLDPRLGGRRLGQGLGDGLHEAALGLQRHGQFRVGEQPLRDEDFRGRQRRQDGGQSITAGRDHLDLAGGKLDAGHRRLAGANRHRRQPVGAACVEQAVLGQGARRHHPHHVAADDGLAAAFARLGGVLHLLADGDLEAGADQLGQIGLRRVHRHARHGDRRALVGAAGRERDAERARGLFGVVEEELVEVAHAEEDQRVGLARLGLEELRHHGARIGGEGIGGRVHRRRRYSVPLTL